MLKNNMNRQEELKQLYFNKFGIKLESLEDCKIELEKVNKLIEQKEKEDNLNNFKWDEYE